jgi:spoIIIJ-associated protein
MNKEELKTVEGVIEQLFALLELDGTFSVEEEGETINVLMDTKDTGLVIGYHGEALESLQLILSLAIAKKLGTFRRVSIEVDGYKKNRVEYLEKLAVQMKEKALEENREQVLSELRSWERRIVHMFLQEDDQVTSESEGRGRERVLVIKPKA